MLIPYLFPKWCSHTPMGILILLDNRDCHVNPVQPACFSSSGSDHFNIRKINYQFFSTVFASSVPSCLCFPTHRPFFFEDSDFLFKYPFIDGKSLHSFSSMFLSVDSHEDANEASSSSLITHSLLRWNQFKFLVLIISFSSFQIPSLAGAPHIQSFLAIQLFQSAQDIPKIRAYTLLSFKLFRGGYQIQTI